MNKRIAFTGLFLLSLTHFCRAQVILPPALQCVNKTASNTDIILDWTNPNNPCGAFVSDTIYGYSATHQDTVFAVINTLTTTDTLFNFPDIGATWYFYMVSNYNCPGSVSVHSDTVSNQNPEVPVIVNVTVTQSGQAIMNWQPDPSPQTAFYIVYIYPPGSPLPTPIDTIYGRLSNSFIDSIDNPTTQSNKYTISAYDSCQNHSGYNTLPQNTILAQASVTECERQLNVSWNAYNNWPQGVTDYKIWVSTNGGPFAPVTSVDSNTLFYSYANFNDGDSLQVYVQAVSGADTTIVSNSNVVRLKAIIVQPPAYIYITNLTVDASNYVDITFTVDTLGQLLFYKVNRGTDSINYLPVNEFQVPYPLEHFQSITDSGAAAQNNPYFYQIVALDSCQNQYVSPYGETVNLQGGLYDFFVTKLTWNDFVLANATVLRYNLYRSFGTGTPYQLIKTFLPGVNTTLDSLEQFLDEKGTFCYQIEAIYYINLPAPSGYHDTLTSYSNVICVIHRPVIYIPNAFSPGGVNNVFKPTIVYGDPTDYSMMIFNRWGAEIFSSNNPEQGWDGTDHGKEANMGGYAYLIQFTADDGVIVQRKGIVLLVR